MTVQYIPFDDTKHVIRAIYSPRYDSDGLHFAIQCVRCFQQFDSAMFSSFDDSFNLSSIVNALNAHVHRVESASGSCSVNRLDASA